MPNPRPNARRETVSFPSITFLASFPLGDGLRDEHLVLGHHLSHQAGRPGWSAFIKLSEPCREQGAHARSVFGMKLHRRPWMRRHREVDGVTPRGCFRILELGARAWKVIF